MLNKIVSWDYARYLLSLDDSLRKKKLNNIKPLYFDNIDYFNKKYKTHIDWVLSIDIAESIPSLKTKILIGDTHENTTVVYFEYVGTKDYIKDNSIAYSIQLIHHEDIDKYNILQATLRGMRLCLDSITDIINIDTILVDGNHFDFYSDKNDNYIDHVCVIDGDNINKSIAAASILAKTYRDEWIYKLVDENPELEKYDLRNNKGYGTKKHLDAIKEYGITKWHRKSFGICKNVNQN